VRSLALAIVPIVAAGIVATAGQDARFRSTSDLVRIYATVTRADGQLVRDLTGADFRVFDNGRPRDIAQFSNEVQAITVALVVDQSGSMLEKLPRVHAAAHAFVNALLPGDRASFATLTHEGVGLTPDKTRLRSAIRVAAEWPWWDSGSPVWGALARGMTVLGPEAGRRVLVVITDGQDTPLAYVDRPSPASPARPAVYPNATGADVAERAMRDGFMLYALGFEGSPLNREIETIARQSGGGVDLIGPNENLSAAFTRIVEDLHTQYLIGFVPVSFDGTVHSITVQCLKTGTSVRARESYFSVAR
jgi:VWFA-related protein